MNLYEIDYNIRALWDKISAQDGELTDEDIQALQSLEVAKDDKITAYGVIIRELGGEIVQIENEAKRIKTILERKVKLQTKLSMVLEEFLKEHQIPKFESTAVNISFRKSTVLEIDEGAKIPKAYLKVKTDIDKTAIKEFLKNGGEVFGCRLLEKQNMQVK